MVVMAALTFGPSMVTMNLEMPLQRSKNHRAISPFPPTFSLNKNFAKFIFFLIILYFSLISFLPLECGGDKSCREERERKRERVGFNG